MEPITLAISAFTAIKAGVSAGKEITSMGKDIGKMFDAIDEVKGSHRKKKNGIISQTMGVNEEALDTFLSQQRAKDLEEELRQIIVYSRGISAWHELIRLRGEIRRERKEEAKRLAKERRDRLEAVFGVALVITGIALLVGFVFFLKSWRS